MNGTYRVVNHSAPRTWLRVADVVHQAVLDAGLSPEIAASLAFDVANEITDSYRVSLKRGDA